MLKPVSTASVEALLRDSAHCSLRLRRAAYVEEGERGHLDTFARIFLALCRFPVSSCIFGEV